MFFIDSFAHNSFCSRKSDAIIDTQTFIKITQYIGTNLFACLTENRNNICQIVLTLGIVRINIFKRFKKTFIIKQVGPCIDFFHFFFKIVGVFLLNNFLHFPISIANNPTISEWVISLSCQYGCNIFVANMEINEALQAFSCYQRCIACNN